MGKDVITMILEYRSKTPDELARIPSHPTERRTRRETLYERTEEDDIPAFPKAEFEAMIKDPETLYEEIVELIGKTRELRTYNKNYQE